MRGIKFVSLHGPGGYGEAARRYMTGLAEAGVPFTWAPMVPARGLGRRRGYEPYQGTDIDCALRPFCNLPIEYDTVLVQTVPEYFPAWAKREQGKRVVGFTAWETDRPPAHWPALLNGVDLLLVPCEWNRDVFRRHGTTTPIEVVPHAAPAAALPSVAGRERFGARPDDLCFYTINDWTARKAVWRTIEAYLDAFTAEDPVVLIVKTTPRDGTRRRWLGRRAGTRWAVDRILARYRRPARVALVTDTLNDAEILALHAAGDCYVSLTRGEGWGLGAFDAAAFGRPVIMTGFGGQLDWLAPEPALLVDYRLVPVHDPRARASYGPDQHWAEPDRGHAGRLMRDVLAHREAAAARGRALQAHVQQRFSPAVVTERLLRAVA